MTNKHFNWHKSWSREASGNLLHTSGLRMIVTRGDGYVDLVADEASLVIFQARETSRGVAPHQILERLKRLLKEAEKWHQTNP